MEQEGPDPSLLQRKIERLEGDLEDAREELAETKEQLAAVSRGQAKLKQALQPVYDGLRMIFGELKNVAADNVSPSQSSGPLDSSRYEPWRQKFRGQTANAIDVLVKYEAGLTRRQLAGFLRVEPGSGTMSQIIFKLNKAELIEKDGSNIRLKKL
ncbi:MAG: hypothetical protein ABSF14_19790 [Terriglobia bacterium]|jgi:hypothetical protein